MHITVFIHMQECKAQTKFNVNITIFFIHVGKFGTVFFSILLYLGYCYIKLIWQYWITSDIFKVF